MVTRMLEILEIVPASPVTVLAMVGVGYVVGYTYSYIVTTYFSETVTVMVPMFD